MTSKYKLTDAAAGRISKKIYLSSGQMKFSYKHLVQILRAEGYSTTIVGDLIRYWWDKKDIGTMASVAGICAREATEANVVLKSLHHAFRDLNDHFPEEESE